MDNYTKYIKMLEDKKNALAKKKNDIKSSIERKRRQVVAHSNTLSELSKACIFIERYKSIIKDPEAYEISIKKDSKRIIRIMLLTFIIVTIIALGICAVSVGLNLTSFILSPIMSLLTVGIIYSESKQIIDQKKQDLEIVRKSQINEDRTTLEERKIQLKMHINEIKKSINNDEEEVKKIDELLKYIDDLIETLFSDRSEKIEGLLTPSLNTLLDVSFETDETLNRELANLNGKMFENR